MDVDATIGSERNVLPQQQIIFENLLSELDTWHNFVTSACIITGKP